VEAAIKKLSRRQSNMSLSVTAGKRGSWAWDGRGLSFCPAIEVPVASSAGAGDAHLAGTLCGLTTGLSLAQAQELATLVAALSVTSVHTIHPAIDRTSLREFAAQARVRLSPPVSVLLEE
jgi:sugar/nucleoside kinase (ribokinase family)